MMNKGSDYIGMEVEQQDEGLRNCAVRKIREKLGRLLFWILTVQWGTKFIKLLVKNVL